MSFGRGGPRVYLPWFLLPFALVVYLFFGAIYVVVWVVAHVAAAAVYGVVWLVRRGVEAADRRSSSRRGGVR